MLICVKNTYKYASTFPPAFLNPPHFVGSVCSDIFSRQRKEEGLGECVQTPAQRRPLSDEPQPRSGNVETNGSHSSFVIRHGARGQSVPAEARSCRSSKLAVQRDLTARSQSWRIHYVTIV